MVSPTTVKAQLDSLTSGGSTGIPIARHSRMYLATLSLEPISEVSIAAMKATG